MLNRSTFDKEMQALEDWYETTLSESQKEKFYRAIQFALSDDEFLKGCMNVCRYNHFFPLPTQIIESAGAEITDNWDKRSS